MSDGALPNLVAVDPGKTCGVAVFWPKQLTLRCFDTNMENLLAALSWLDTAEPIVDIAIERWLLYPNAAKKLTFHTMPGPEAIGMVRAWGIMKGGVTLERINAINRLPFVEYGPNIPQLPKTKHYRDAIAIGLAWYARRGLLKHLGLLEDWEIIYYAGVRTLKELLNESPER